MIDYGKFFDCLEQTGIGDIAQRLCRDTITAVQNIRHGDLEKWLAGLDGLPEIEPSVIDLGSTVCIGSADDCSEETRARIAECLKQFHPWRKGPFELFGTHIDTEWRSDLKWDRLKDHIDPLEGKLVLDIGCGNGYHCFRMAQDRPSGVIGIDPFLLYVMQFHAVNRYAGLENVAVLPLGIEDIPKEDGCFDSIFSMGVLYHRRDPLEHLNHIRNLLAPGGQAVIETLVIEGKDCDCLKPKGRYAKMRNVFAIPSIKTLTDWISRAGFGNIRVIDVTRTTAAEQSKTQWMTFESLEDFLDPVDPAKTIEGHPAPVRAVILAKRC